MSGVMGIKPRSPGKTAVSISMPESLLALMDERAQALGLNRSQYLAQLAKADLAARGDLTLSESPKSPLSVAPKAVGDRELIKYPPLIRK